jgi:PAS domain S-box-containing protein
MSSAVPSYDDLAQRIGELERENEQLRAREAELVEREKALQQAVRLGERILDSIPDIIGLQEPDHTIRYYNQAGYDFLKLSPQEAKGKKCFQLIGRQECCNPCATSEAVATGRPAEHERHFPELNVFMNCRSIPLFDCAGNLSQVIEILRDVTDRRTAEQALRESEERFRAMFESIGDSVFLKGVDLRYSKVNPAMERLFGLPADQLVGRSDEDLFGSDAARYIKAQDERVLAGKIIDDEHSKPVNGQQRVFQVNKAPVYDAEGNVVGLCGMARDITERKRMEDTVVAMNQSLQTILDSIPADIYVSDIDTHEILFMNAQMKRSFGRDCVGEICWRAFRAQSEPCAHCTNPDILDNEGQPTGVTTWEGYNPVSHKWYLNYDQAVPWLDGRYVRIQVAMDISQRKQAEESLQNKTREMTTFINNIPYMAWLKDEESNFIMVNKTFGEVVGLDPSILKNQSCAACFGQEQAERMKHDDRRVLEYGKPLVIEESIVDRQGRRRCLETSKAPIINDRGDIVGTVGIGVDVTERKEAEALRIAKETAEAASRAKSDFLAKMSHEIRTPLNAIMGMHRLLLSEDLPAKQRKRLHVAKESAESLLWLLNDLLDLSRIESGKFVLQEKEFRPRRFLRHVMQEMELLATEKGLPLYLSVDKHLPTTLHGDPHRLKQVLMNLLSNAIKFTNQGWISLRAKLVEPVNAESLGSLLAVDILFEVEDTGRGIEPEYVQTIFEAYEQGYYNSSSVEQGAGLGLAICQKLCQQMGGSIWAKSSPGSGSIFSVRIPFTTDGQVIDEPEADSYPDVEHWETMAPLQILLVEDQRMNQIFTVDLLASQGHCVEVASDGRRALDMLARKSFDLVLMDIKLPNLDGIETTRRIRTADPLLMDPDIPIIGLSAHVAPQEEVERFQSAGFDQYVIKPVSFEKLFSAMKEALHRHGKQRRSRPEPEG